MLRGVRGVGIGLVVLWVGHGCGDDDGTVTADGGSRDAQTTVDAAADGVGPLWFERIELPAGVDILTSSTFLPGRDRELLLGELDGTLHHVRVTEDRADLLGTFSIADTEFGAMDDCGLLEVAVDPEFAANGYVWLGHCGPNFETRVRRVRFDDERYDDIAASSAILVNVEATGSAFHTVGTIGFDPDGTLFTFLGDKDTRMGQSAEDLLATMIRVVPDADGSGFSPAPNNPYVGAGGPELEEVYALGIRNGFRATRDRVGRYWVGDVGANAAEEVNLITEPGQNFGWADCEGSCDRGFVDPILEWPHSDERHPYFADDPLSEATVLRTVWVGSAYVAQANDPYDGFFTDRVPFGDLCLGWVRGAWAEESTHALAVDELWGHLPHITSWEQGTDGFLYVTTFGSCDSRDPFDPPGLWRVRLRSN